MQHTKDANAATVTMQPSTVTPIPDVISQPEATSQTTTPSARTTTKRKVNTDTYNKIGYTLALVGAGAGALLLWFIGANYTLRGLQLFGIDANGLTWWLLPITITAIELWLMPKKHTKPLLIVFFLIILAFDVLTSWYGLILDLAGRTLPLATGITLPKSGAPFHITMIILSLAFAFVPEKLAKIAIKEAGVTWL